MFCRAVFGDLRRHGARGAGARNRSADWKRATWQRRALVRAQCRFKMASVRDRYRGICVENDRICDVSGCESAGWLPWQHGAFAPHPALAHEPLNVRISTILRRHSAPYINT